MPPSPPGFLKSIAAVYDAEPRPEGPLAAEALLRRGPVWPPVQPCAQDAGIRACLAGSDHPCAVALQTDQGLIPWGINPVSGRMTDSAAAMIAVCTLMGPGAAVDCADALLGLLYIEPDRYYPLHNHDADETYVIVAGSALWTAGEDTRLRHPGDMIHHPSLLPHAFRTGPAGLVALWRWSGDINTHSYTFLPDPAA